MRFALIVVSLLAGSPLWAAETLKVHRIAGDEGQGSFANSVLLEGEKELFLVDTQRTTANATHVIERIRTLGKELKTVFITHAHPDHMLGSADIKKAFPTAKFLAHATVVADMTAKAETMRSFVAKTLASAGSRDTVPDSVVIPEATEKNEIVFEGRVVEILEVGPGESPASAMLLIPSIRALIAGDTLYNETHLFLNDKRFAEWIQILEKLKVRKGIETIYPGHGESTSLRLIDENIRYIRRYEDTLKHSASGAEAVARMKEHFPRYKMERFLEFGIGNHFSRLPR